MKVFAQDVNLPSYSGTGFNFGSASLGEIFSQLLNYAIVLAGIAMFGFLIAGGFDLLTSGGNQEGIKKGTNKIVMAIVGFIVVFATYFILEIIELLFGIKVTG
jgi:hypothetical protein